MKSPKNLKISVSHLSPTPFVRHAVRGIYEREMLSKYYVAYLDHPDYWLSKIFKECAREINPAFVKELERRSFSEIPICKVRTYPLWEIIRTLLSRYTNRSTISDLVWEFGERKFDQWVAEEIKGTESATYTYEHAGLETLKCARRKGIMTFHDQPSQHHTFFQEIYEHQAKKNPHLAHKLNKVYKSKKSQRRNKRRDRELEIADYIVCNSSFTKYTLTEAGTDPGKILVTPYGCPEIDPKPQTSVGRVIFLNAGTQNLRKGLHLLYQAWKQLQPQADKAALQLIGKMELPESLRRGLPGDVQIEGSIPHRELLNRYQEASVFVLPSLADGFGMVVTEAMSRGLPVITTENTGAADLITHGENGFVIPANDAEALHHQMNWCIENRHRLPEIGRKAVETARSWQWSDYRAELVRTMRDKIEEWQEHQTQASERNPRQNTG